MTLWGEVSITRKSRPRENLGHVLGLASPGVVSGQTAASPAGQESQTPTQTTKAQKINVAQHS